jgi:predicted ATPase
MFRLLSLNFQNEILGHIPADKLVFVPKEEREITKYPYTSVIIGQNGSGKSNLLYYMAEIFQDLAHLKDFGKRRKITKINFNYTIEYKVDNDLFKISQRRNSIKKLPNGKVEPPGWYYQISINGIDLFDNDKVREKVKIPSSVIAVCYLPMDRFSKKSNMPDDFYVYLGLVDKTNAARPRQIMNNVIPLLFDTIIRRKSVKFLKEILKFMQVDEDYLGIKNKYRYKEYFFTGDLTTSKFIDLFANWKNFSQRKEKPFGVQYFESKIGLNPNLISKIVRYINLRSEVDKIQIGKKSLLEFNLFDNRELLEDWELLIHLRRLDLIESFSLVFRKSRSLVIDDNKLSSGEFHYFSTVIAICGSIKNDSLILIDEPETSLHPNWQMNYINHLKQLLESQNSSHFVISTHSHFIVSDLEGASSEVIGIIGQAPNISAEPLERNTFGWSAEEVLFKVFNLRSTRNFFFESTILELLHLISNKSMDLDRINALTGDLKKTELDRNDPLSQILKEADDYVRNI